MWLDGEISTGKLLQLCNVPRGCGDDLLGFIWHDLNKRFNGIMDDIESRISNAEFNGVDAKKLRRKDDQIAEAAAKTAYINARMIIQSDLGKVLNNTKAT